MSIFRNEKVKEFANNLKEGSKECSFKKHTLLIVDDEVSNLSILVDLFKDEYNLLTAGDGQEALELIENDHDPTRINLILTDNRMPKLSGIEFLKQSIAIIPQSIRMIITGYTDKISLINSINESNIYKFIAKPYDSNDLKITVQRALEAYDLKKSIYDLGNVFEKFVPKQFLSRIAPEGVKHLKFGEAKSENMTILFSDIHFFGKLSREMGSQELLDFLNIYLKRVSDPIHQNHGFIDKFIRDAVMALFDRSDQTVEEHANDAVSAAISMQKSINVYNSERVNTGSFPIEIGIGLHSGVVVVGTVGSKNRMDSTVLGDSVNLSSRLKGLTRTYNAKILISASTYNLLDQSRFNIREVDTTLVKGKIESITVYEIFDADSPEIMEKKLATRDCLHEGIHLFKNSNPEQAIKCFEECLSLFPQDIVASEFIKRNYFT